MVKNEENRFVFVLPSKRSGGSNVMLTLFLSLVNNDQNIGNRGLVIKRLEGGVLSSSFSLIFYIIKNYLLGKSKSVSYVVTDPFHSIICSLLSCRYIRYLQADDLNLFKHRRFGRIICLVQRVASIRDDKYLYVSDYVKRRYLDSKLGNTSVQGFKVLPLVDPIYFRKGSAKNREKYTIAYMPRRALTKGFDEFCLWMNEAPARIREKMTVNFISNEVSKSVIDKKCEFSFTLTAPSNVEDIKMVLESSNIFVFNSYTEGFGLPPLEALLSGCQIISTKCGGVSEFLDEGNSELIDLGDRESFYFALEKLVFGKKKDLSSNNYECFSKYNSIFLSDLNSYIKGGK